MPHMPACLSKITQLWNKLPNHIRDTTSFKTFKTFLRPTINNLFITSVPQHLLSKPLILLLCKF